VITHYHDYNFLNIYQKIHNFCVIELGGFYLDVIKDRQYTTRTDSLARRSTQTAMYQVVEMLSRLIAPILSFTADEIWQHLPGERAESVFLSDFSNADSTLAESADFSDEFWQKVITVKTAVNRELESKRAEKLVGSGLSAEVDLYCNAELATLLNRFGTELRFVLMVSRAGVNSLEDAGSNAVTTGVDGLKLEIRASDYSKCERCWHHHEDVGQSTAHPAICQRCIDNIEGDGESRSFV
jgi:isoleucyl-tRNA synthetase